MTGPGLGSALAANGWPVFPCHPDTDPCPYPPGKCECKAPLTRNGFKDATTDPGQIRAWWRRWPSANVAIATGAPGPDVLDIDVKPDGSGWTALGRLKRAGLLTGAAALIRTPSGGAHVYYAGTSQGCHALPRHHLDFKSLGGYVLAPPSRVHGKPYELVDRRADPAALDWQAVRRLLVPARPARKVTRTAWTGGDLPPAVRRQLAKRVTDRSAALHGLVATAVRAGMDPGAIHQLAAAYQPACEKYGPRLADEVERCLAKIGAP
jgi:Bifunctional DNA primase/polymerase, N-terminal